MSNMAAAIGGRRLSGLNILINLKLLKQVPARGKKMLYAVQGTQRVAQVLACLNHPAFPKPLAWLKEPGGRDLLCTSGGSCSLWDIHR